MARVAVIGTGIAGLAVAELLRQRHSLAVFEADTRAGGHARTIDAGGRPVDTGFIVYNEVNYPLLTRLFRHLGVETKASDMSFGVRHEGDGVELAANSLKGLFAQKRNLVRPSHWSMLADTLRFFRGAPAVLDQPGDPTLGELLDRMRLGKSFRNRFLVPMGAAIWSTPPEQMLGFPAKSFVRFFANHGLLSVSGQHPWRTVVGGSRTYVARIVERLGSALRLAAPVASVNPQGGKVEVVTRAGERETFDAAVLACHADEALRLVVGPTDEERAILSAFEFRNNLAFLHRDARLMPKRKAAWASWNYAAGGDEAQGRVSITYWMNRLQGFAGEDLFVTLNPERKIAPEHIIDMHMFRHPVFSREAMAAQARIADIQGKRGLYWAGAWQRYGFHEDGIWSAVRVAEALGEAVPWT